MKKQKNLKKQSDEPCSECNKNRWRMWVEYDVGGWIQPLLKSCEKCNPDGMISPPFYENGDKKKEEMEIIKVTN